MFLRCSEAQLVRTGTQFRCKQYYPKNSAYWVKLRFLPGNTSLLKQSITEDLWTGGDLLMSVAPILPLMDGCECACAHSGTADVMMEEKSFHFKWFHDNGWVLLNSAPLSVVFFVIVHVAKTSLWSRIETSLTLGNPDKNCYCSKNSFNGFSTANRQPKSAEMPLDNIKIDQKDISLTSEQRFLKMSVKYSHSQTKSKKLEPKSARLKHKGHLNWMMYGAWCWLLE